MMKKILVALLLLGLVTGTAMGTEIISLQFENANYADIYQTLGEVGGFGVLIDQSVTGRGSIVISNRTLIEALDLVSELSGYSYSINEDSLLVAGRDQMERYEEWELRYLYPRYLTPDGVVKALGFILDEGNIYVQDNNSVIISGSEARLNEAEALMLQLDRPHRDTLQGERTVLEILQQLADLLQLDLIADPSLANESLVIDVWRQDPRDVLKLIEQRSQVKVEERDGLLIANVVDEVGEAAPERIKVYRLNHTEPATAARIMEFVLPPEKIQIDQISKSVMVRATNDQIAEIDEFLLEFDQPVPQVLLEVWIQEMSDDAISAFGFDWNSSFDGINLKQTQGSANPGYLELSWEPWEIVFALQALEEAGKVKILASPKIATLSGEEASIFVGDRVPIVLIVDDEGREDIEFLESGINLKVLPRISDDGYITISVRPEVSTFSFVEGDPYPHIRTREAETVVRVKDGQPILIGGLLQEQEVESIAKVPFLSELPILGKLFSKTNTSAEQTEMNIFLIPHIVDGSEGLVSNSFFTPTQ